MIGEHVLYGTIFNLQPKPGHKEELLKVLNLDNKVEGGVAWFLMDPDDKDELIGVAVFESKEAHIANSNRPEQHEFFTRMMEHLVSEPVWTDGTYVLGEII